MADSDICCAKWGDDHDSANETGLRLEFVEIRAFLYPKIAPQNVLQKANFETHFGRPLRAKGDCDVTETHLQ